mmetsp:Transcript_19545/g.50110  ORF Transcript_19545/g.50110 Transcript_19545/m.50110 type:complete len:225 (+) Transcript_19545:574-1248(+)
MHRRGIEWLGTAIHTQEPCSLVVRLWADTLHCEHLRAGREGASGRPVFDDVARQRCREACNVLQKRGRGRVQVNTDGVHAVHYGSLQLAHHPPVVHVVLVQAHADALRVDLHKLGHGVEESPGNRNRSAHGDIHVRQLLPRKRGRAVHTGTSLVHDTISDAPGKTSGATDVLAQPRFGFSAGGPVADGAYQPCVRSVRCRRLLQTDLQKLLQQGCRLLGLDRWH